MTVHDLAVEPARPAAPSGFDGFGLHAAILKGVHEAGFREPSPIQTQAIPIILAGRDLIAQAQTGTGKTAAFGLPCMHRIVEAGGRPGVQMLVITPTRELASQVSEELFRLGRFAKVSTAAVYGGQSSQRQIDLVSRGAQIVVATPGRLLDQLGSGRFRDFHPPMVVLDEADEMLDMGFLDDIKQIFTFLPQGEARQTLMFSATMPAPIRKLAGQILREPVTLNLSSTTEVFNADVEQFFYVIEESERVDAVIRLIDAEVPEKALIFCRTKRETDDLSVALVSRGVPARALHGDMEQNQRQQAIRAFKDGAIDILVATDVAARGLDVSGLTHVFNFHMPFDQESYVHRIGRTGRAGKKGKAITLVTPAEFARLRRIQHAIKASFIHGEIPSLADVHKQSNARLVRALCTQAVRDDAVGVLNSLQQDMDLTEAACKLISMMLDKRAVRGPSRIGLSRAQATDRMSRRPTGPRPGGPGYGPRKPKYYPRGARPGPKR